MLVFQLKIALSDIIQQREEKQNKTKKEKKKNQTADTILCHEKKPNKLSHKCRLNEDLGILQSSPSGA